MQRKLELTFIGCLFTFLNLSLLDYPIVGIFFGILACVFFIKALMIKE